MLFTPSLYRTSQHSVVGILRSAVRIISRRYLIPGYFPLEDEDLFTIRDSTRGSGGMKGVEKIQRFLEILRYLLYRLYIGRFVPIRYEF